VIRKASVALALVAPSMALSTACHRPAQTSPPTIVADSARGFVSITGTSFEQRIVLRSGIGAIRLSAAASDSSALSRMGGIEILVVGRRTPNVFVVDHFTAITVGGSPVTDGILRNDDGRLLLETARGRIPLGNPPTALRSMIGARVWIGGPFDTGPNTYGVIAPSR
jgi:hypothetical protein